MEKTTSKVHFSKEVIEQVPATELDEIIKDGTHIIIDVRSPQGIENQGYIPGAINIPLEELKNQIEDRYSNPESILNSDRPFLFACTGGVMSYLAAIHAQENGIKQVFNLEGGHAAWKSLSETKLA